MSKPSPQKTISLVLGSGGARGFAHIGIIRWLEEHDFRITSISGSSIGALVGGVYAMGKLDEFEHWACAIRKIDILTLLDIAWQKTGLVKGDKIIHSLVDLLGDQLIEELPISYTAVATDIENQKEIWIQSGKLFNAIRASISLPLFFTPVQYKGIDLIDGGILNPVPIAPTFGAGTDFTIAVNLNGDIKASPNLPELDSDSTHDSSNGVYDSIRQFIHKLQPVPTGDKKRDWGVYDIVNQAFDAMQTAIARQKLAAYPPDYLIEIPGNVYGTLEFDHAEELIRLGYHAAEKQLKGLIDPNH